MRGVAERPNAPTGRALLVHLKGTAINWLGEKAVPHAQIRDLARPWLTLLAKDSQNLVLET